MNTKPKEHISEKHLQKLERHDHRVEHVFRRILHTIERIIAAITIIVMVGAFCMEVYRMVTTDGYVASTFLHNVLTIVVGLEFVRMLIDTTPASILEVLTVAITRQVILNHDDVWAILICVICIAGLFGIRRFLVRHKELKEEMVEQD